MRVTTAFNRMLQLPGAWVIDVSFGAEGVIVTVRCRRRRVCSGCGQLGGHVHGRRVKRWRHLDLGANRSVIECELRRLWCHDCGARYEGVPWALPGSGYTRDFEDVVAWLAQQMARSRSLGCCGSPGTRSGGSCSASSQTTSTSSACRAWSRSALTRSHAGAITAVVGHEAGAVVWCSPGRNAATLQAFFELLGERRHTIKAVSIDMSGGYEKAIRDAIPEAEIAFDPFTSSSSRSARSTRSAATSGTPTSAPTLPRAAGSKTPAGRS